MNSHTYNLISLNVVLMVFILIPIISFSIAFEMFDYV